MEKCFLDVRLMCAKIRVVFEMNKMFNKNILMNHKIYKQYIVYQSIG